MATNSDRDIQTNYHFRPILHQYLAIGGRWLPISSQFGLSHWNERPFWPIFGQFGPRHSIQRPFPTNFGPAVGQLEDTGHQFRRIHSTIFDQYRTNNWRYGGGGHDTNLSQCGSILIEWSIELAAILVLLNQTLGGCCSSCPTSMQMSWNMSRAQPNWPHSWQLCPKTTTTTFSSLWCLSFLAAFSLIILRFGSFSVFSSGCSSSSSSSSSWRITRNRVHKDVGQKSPNVSPLQNLNFGQFNWSKHRQTLAFSITKIGWRFSPQKSPILPRCQTENCPFQLFNIGPNFGLKSPKLDDDSALKIAHFNC